MTEVVNINRELNQFGVEVKTYDDGKAHFVFDDNSPHKATILKHFDTLMNKYKLKVTYGGRV